jgi:methyl-accepting chemotaxis protein
MKTSTMKLSTKLMLGFGVLAGLAVVLGGAGFYGANRTAEDIREVGSVRLPGIEAVLQLRNAEVTTKSIQRTLMLPGLDPAVQERQSKLAAEAKETAHEAIKTCDAMPWTAAERAEWQKFLTVWESYEKANDEFMRMAGELKALKIGDPVKLERDLATFRGMHADLLAKVFHASASGTMFEGGEDHTACAFGKWLAGYKAENSDIAGALKEIAANHQHFHAGAKAAKDKVRASDLPGAVKIALEEMQPAAKATFAQFDHMLKIAGQATALQNQLEKQAMTVCRPFQRDAEDLLDQISAADLKAGHERTEKAIAFGAQFKIASLILVFAALVVAIVLALTLTRSIAGPIRNMATQLGLGANQVSEAAAEVASTSQTVAQGASQQAASLEETSASLEEIAAMTKRNADNASNGKGLSQQSRDAATSGLDRIADMHRTLTSVKGAVTDMKTAVNEMQASSQEIAKIIKTIDEIAFQTNLLALNAAVEAARAGEAGAGFAVVADEVRSLAQRSAQAAKDTSEKIEAAVKRSANGVVASTKVADSLGEIEGSARNIEQVFNGIVTQVKSLDEVIAEIASASKEQSQGITELNTAVGQMDRVTQTNAASAEENASSSEQLGAQAAVLQEVVDRLQQVVTGHSANVGPSAPPPKAAAHSRTVTNPGPARPAKRASAVPPVPPAPGFRDVPKDVDIPMPAAIGSNTGAFKDF